MRRPALFHIIFLATEPIAGQGHGQGAFLGTLKMPRDFKGTLAGGSILYSILYSILCSILYSILVVSHFNVLQQSVFVAGILITI